MKKQVFEYNGDKAFDIIDTIADELDKLPYEAETSSYEGEDEVFFFCLCNAFDDELHCVVTSGISMLIQPEHIKVEVITTAPQTDLGMEGLALKDQLRMWEEFFTNNCFKQIENKDKN